MDEAGRGGRRGRLRAPGAPAGGRRKAREAEEREALRQVHDAGSSRRRAHAAFQPFGRARLIDSLPEAPPQLSLPERRPPAALAPVPSVSSPAAHARSISAGGARSGRTDRRHGGRLLNLRARRSSSGRSGDPRGGRTGCVARARRDRHRRPRAAAKRRARAPRILVGFDSRRRGDGVVDEGPWGGKSTFAQTPSANPGVAPRPAGHPLRQPALHPAGRNGDDLGRERVLQRLDKERAQRLDEAVGSFCSMYVKHGLGTRLAGARPTRGCVRDSRMRTPDARIAS